MIYIKRIGTYEDVKSAHVKVNGSYQNVSQVYVKRLGVYEGIDLGESTDPGYDPTDDLNSIEITNDLVANTNTEECWNNVWGNGNAKDKSNQLIADTFNSYFGGDSSGTTYYITNYFTCVLPQFTPLLNKPQSWLDSKEFVISGSTAAVTTANQIQVRRQKDYGSYDLFKNNAAAALQTTLNNNSVILHTAEKGIKFRNNFISSPSAIDFASFNIDRVDRVGGKGGIHCGVLSGPGNPRDGSTWRDDFVGIWKWEVDVAYTLTITHTPSGQSRTINHVIRFRTY